MIRILIVEDHQQVRQVIRDLLGQHCSVVGELNNAEAIAASVQSLQPDVLVMDVSLPGRSGMQVLPELRSKFPRLGIVITTNHDEPTYRSAAFARGADGFVLKDKILRDLFPTVQNAHLIQCRLQALDIKKA